MRRRHPGFAPAFVDDLITLELDPADAELAICTREWVLARMGGAGQVSRAGLNATGALLSLVVCLRTGRPYGALGSERRLTVARRLAVSQLPLVADYVRAVRALAVTYFYEARFPT